MAELAAGFDAFLSYASSDRAKVQPIQRFLERALKVAGIAKPKVYVDSTDIRGGDLTTELRGALARSRALIVCCSPAARKSDWVAREISAFAEVQPNVIVLPVLLSGEPANAIPEALGKEVRFHDLRGCVWLGFITPAGRDELLRIVAVLTGADLRSLINWNRRRLLKLGVGAAAVGVPAVGTGAWLYDQATRVHASECSARVVLRRSGDFDWDGGKTVHETFSDRATLTVRGGPAGYAPKPPWPTGPTGPVTAPAFSISGSETRKTLMPRHSTAGPSFTSIREYSSLQGKLGSFDRRGNWDEAVFDALLEIQGVDMDIQQGRSNAAGDRPSAEEARFEQAALTRQFDQQYGITAEMRDSWHDYSVRVVPITADIQLLVKNEPVWSSDGIAARLWEGDEDVRRRHVIYFPPVSPQARRRQLQKKS